MTDSGSLELHSASQIAGRVCVVWQACTWISIVEFDIGKAMKARLSVHGLSRLAKKFRINER